MGGAEVDEMHIMHSEEFLSSSTSHSTPFFSPPPPPIIALSISPASISTFPKSFIFIVRLFCLRIRLHLTMEALLPTTLISIAKMELFLTFSWMMMMDSPLYLLPFPWTR